MNIFKKFDERYGSSSTWQFIKFNLVSSSVSLLQLLLANILPFFFDPLKAKLPVFLRGIFDPKSLFSGETPYVVDGIVTWGYVLPFFLSNFIANIYGYFVNMKMTFKGKGSRKGIAIYCLVLLVLILFSTWLQGRITAMLMKTDLAFLARTISATLAGLVQVAVIFPLEKYVLFKENANE